ncbi:MAG: hypothetical protein JXR82_13605 [Marinifilaceae bacterium]|nr:hypothetical protein [Marinifilaceae bacterium]
MPFNLLKRYNHLLEIDDLNFSNRIESLRGVFDRDIVNNDNFSFRGKSLNPTPKDGEIPIDTLFSHLTTTIVDGKTKKREFERDRSIRIHWIKNHLREKEGDLMVFSTKDKGGIRTYVYDKKELYVIVLEPLRKIDEYYLLTAYYLTGKNRFKIEKKYKRRLDELL